MTSHWLGLLLSGVGATIGIIGWEGQHRYRPLMLLLGGMLSFLPESSPY
jgi:hypothetical protein